MPNLPAFAPEHARNRAAAEAFAAADLPTTEEEVWRYSPVGELDVSRYRPAPVPEPAEGIPDAAVGILDLARGIASVGIVTVDGHVVHTELLGGRTVDGLVDAVGAPGAVPDLGAPS